jgi:hypothetical protein
MIVIRDLIFARFFKNTTIACKKDELMELSFEYM